MNRLSTIVLCLSVLFSLNYCSPSKYYYSPRPDADSTIDQAASKASDNTNKFKKYDKKSATEESLGNRFFVRKDNSPKKQ